jgi:cation transport ATPase
VPHSDVPRLGTIDLVSGIVEDARDLVGAHVDGLREDISSRLTTLTSMMIAAGVFVVTAMLLGLALAASIVALGAPWWLALWIVTPISGAIGFGFVRRAHTSNEQRKQP